MLSRKTPLSNGRVFGDQSRSGYALVHAFGAAFDNPDLIVACVVGDGEAETGPLAAAWHSNKFLNPRVDGAVLPILHLNGYKIANPTLLARMDVGELKSLFTGYGYDPFFVEGSDPMAMHGLMAATLDEAMDRIRDIQTGARKEGWSKFIIMVPSIAIREGIHKSLQITADHFTESYGKKVRFFIYNSKRLHELESFSSDAGINVMVINIQAFAARGADNRRIYEELDDFQSRKPIDVIVNDRGNGTLRFRVKGTPVRAGEGRTG